MVALQDAKSKGVVKIEDLRDVPIEISIALDNDMSATGFVYVEEGSLAQNKSEYIQLNVLNAASKIEFVKQNVGSVDHANMTIIDKITVSFINKAVNASCALMKDQSVVPLYVSTYNYEMRQQITIQPKFLLPPGQSGIIRVNEIVYIGLGVAQSG